MGQGLALVGFLVVASVVVLGMVAGSLILRVRPKGKASKLKVATYECGEEPTGMAWLQFHARYYVVALFFVLFDIEAAFLLPWSVIVREAGKEGLVAVVSFVAVLMLGWVWAVRKRALEWQ